MTTPPFTTTKEYDPSLEPGQIFIKILLDHDGGFDENGKGEYNIEQIMDIIRKEFEPCNVLHINITAQGPSRTEEVMKRKREWHEKMRKKKD
jgi:hypothetical protein